ncbi:HET domain-containing protein [Fusarium sp. LHS14.1]|nr:HET domain-containing protein [Fusarium sp. LHS14.1]
MTGSSDLVHTTEWRCLKCRAIPWDCQQWELNPETALLERDLQLQLDHHDSSVALEASAAAGCSLCSNLRARILHWLSDRDELPSGQCKLWFHRGVDIHFQIGDNHHHDVFEALVRSKSATWLPEWDDTPGPAPSPKSFLPETTDDDLKALIQDSIKPWFNDCVNGNRLHRKCRYKFKMDEIGAMPKRLIDVGNGQDPKAKLIISEDEFGQALSENEQTTRANLASRLKYIDESVLPKTIQDTIKVTRLLGFRYLWVDALCFIQSHPDDNYQDDFKAEAPKMGAYYTNAVCLISALGAPDSSTGLLVPRPAHRYPTSSCVIGFDTRTNEYIHLPPSKRTLADEFDASPLLKRGWCFQERLLARRTIYWSRNGVFWNCIGDNATRSEFSTRCEEFATDSRISNSCVFHGVQGPTVGWGLPWEPWMNYIHEYSAKAFSFAKDRLVAVHGLGSRLAAIHGGEYFAGVFSSHISWRIMWEADPENDGRKKLDYFPSWSWASCQSDLGVIITDTTKPWIECARFVGFPAVQDPLDFQPPEKRMLRLNAPLLNFKPGQYQHGTHTSYDFEVSGVQFNVYYTYDTLGLVPTTQEDLYILIVLLGRVQKGILLRARSTIYERVGYTSLYYMGWVKGVQGTELLGWLPG